ncbi:MAG: hypothetical protein VX473_03720, partial [Candidatus Thermoplasmatota archaeon]|nr:hypothetical protein [Candidatus Thermoplasmatota archaeon]
MARQKVTQRAQPVSISFPLEILRRLDDFAQRGGLSRSQVVVDALGEILPSPDSVRDEFRATSFKDGILVAMDSVRFKWNSAWRDSREKPPFSEHLVGDSYVQWIRSACRYPDDDDWRPMVPEYILEWIDAYLPNLEQMYNIMDCE